MNKYSNRCGTCIFSKEYRDQKDEVEKVERVTCIFGGEVNGPYDAYSKPCMAFVRKPTNRATCSKPVVAVAGCTKEKATKSIVGVKDDTVWTQQMDDYLKRMFDDHISVWGMSTNLGVDRISIVNRMRALGLKRTSEGRKKAEQIVDGNNLPLDQQKYPGIKCCKGLCCKYKESCQHYLHWIEMGKPQRKLINSVSTCINTSYGINHSETTNTYFEYIGVDGSRTPDPITFAEACQ